MRYLTPLDFRAVHRISLLLFAACVGSSQSIQPNAILDDLERRAMAALDSVPRAHNREEAELQKTSLRPKLEVIFQLDRSVGSAPLPAQLVRPDKLESPAPAVVIIHPHDDPGDDRSVKLTRDLVGAGIIVLNLDLRKFHSNMDLLPVGLTPESLMQHEVRGAVLFLSSRKEIDAHRIGLIGDGLSASFAAALNPQFAVIMLSDGGPDLRSVVGEMRALQGDALPDSCYLVPDLVRYAAPHDLFAMIAPRPLLAMNSSLAVLEYSNEIYSSYGKGANLRQISVDGRGDQSNYETCLWFARWLQNTEWKPAVARPSFTTEVDVSYIAPNPATPPRVFRPKDLQDALGQALPEGTISFGLKVALVQHITLVTQKGFALPVTVFRPGATGGGGESATLIAITDAGQETLGDDEVVREAVRRNWIVWAVDPRGLGSLKVGPMGFIFVLDLWLGENFAWRQALDVLRIIEGVGGFNQNHEAALYARGPNSSVIAAFVSAMAGRNQPAWVAVRDGVTSFWDTRIPLYISPFGMMGNFDIPNLTANALAKTITIISVDDFRRADW